MNFNGSKDISKIRHSHKLPRRNFFYYIGAAAVSTFVFSKIPFGFFRKKIQSSSRSSIKVTENPFAVKRTGPSGLSGKGPVNG